MNREPSPAFRPSDAESTASPSPPPGAFVATYFHGTRADLEPGDLIAPGNTSNYGSRRAANFVYLSSTLDAAIWGAELAFGDQSQRIYAVQPIGPLEDDPNVTDKRFPGNPTKSYRTREPVTIVGEVIKWRGHDPETLAAMRNRLAELKRAGVEHIDE